MKLAKLFAFAAAVTVVTGSARAHKLEPANVRVEVAKSGMSVTPSIDWNSVGGRHGKRSEVWTLDGDRLNEVIFLGGLEAGGTLTRAPKHAKLPTWETKMLLVELPEFVEQTYRTARDIKDYTQLNAAPRKFLGRDGVGFDYEFVNGDGLPVRGTAVATIVDGKLYMMSLNAPRIAYFDRAKSAFDALVTSARLR
jgi:hypothetical protein